MPQSSEQPAPGSNRRLKEIGRVFLSATVKDLKHYRQEVQEALRGIEIDILLQEEWNEAAGLAVDICLQRIHEADGYLGLYGYRYGWVPDGNGCSITELECRFARDQWPEEPPPIFWFLPRQGSDAAVQLEGYADEALQEDHPEDPEKRAESKRRQQNFWRTLQVQGRVIRDFGTLAELRERSIAVISNWNRRALKTALEAQPAEGSRASAIPALELGAIDRESQRDALYDALSTLGRRTDAPAMCLVVHGDEAAGHSAFLDWLAHWDGWNLSRDVVPSITPPHDQFDATSLVAAASSMVSADVPAGDGVDVLADAVLTRLDTEPVVLTVSALHRLQGGLRLFHAGFWRPLFDALQAKWRPEKNQPHRLVLVVDWREAMPATSAELVWPGDPCANNLDYRRLVPLPQLHPFAPRDVETWLRSLGMQGRRCRDIAERVTRDASPLLVFERLHGEGFWAELARG